MPKWIDNLLLSMHRHDMQKVAHWCDKECSIIIVEYKCCKCTHEAWDFIYFDDERCKVLTRVPVEVSSFNAPILAECGEPNCEIANQKKPKKRKPAGSRTSKDTKTSC